MDLRDDEEFIKFYNTVGKEETIPLAIYAKWSPERIHEMIELLKDLDEFYRDVTHTADNEETKVIYENRRDLINEQLTYLRSYRDLVEESILYNPPEKKP